ncbi:hypothetical protein BH10ACI3_BH10ACI3_14150 [soil metagenome]
MKAFRKLIVTIIAAACFSTSMLGGAVTVAPVKSEPQQVRWRDASVKISISSSLTQQSPNLKIGTDVLGAVRRSLQTWRDAAGINFQIEISDRQSLSPSGVSGDGVNLITIAQTPENVLLFSRSRQTESAKTRVFYNRKGFITEADIVLNPFQQFSTDGTFGTFDLESTLTHEIGHLLGLRHSGVLGSTMSDSLPKNGLFGLIDLGPRTLSDSDIAAIRELYGTASADDTCCASITGKINIPVGRTSKGLRVWAEEDGTGRVMAQADTGLDGNYRLGGLPAGAYLVFWQKKDDPSASQIGELGLVRLEPGEAKSLNEKASFSRTSIAMDLVGLNSQLSDSAISLNAGREYVIYVGGRVLDPRDLTFEFNSPFLRISPGSTASQDFGAGVTAVSFVLCISDETPAGSYSVFAITADGSRSALVGAINVDR